MAKKKAREKGRPPGERRDNQHAVEQFHLPAGRDPRGKRWQDFIDLFATTACTGCRPSLAHHLDGMPAIFAEDKSLMTVRMKRVCTPTPGRRTALGHEPRRRQRRHRKGIAGRQCRRARAST